jgi:hypothetical protein
MCEKHELIIINLDITVREWENVTNPTSYSDGKTLPHNSARSARLHHDVRRGTTLKLGNETTWSSECRFHPAPVICLPECGRRAWQEPVPLYQVVSSLDMHI